MGNLEYSNFRDKMDAGSDNLPLAEGKMKLGDVPIPQVQSNSELVSNLSLDTF
jgi:hypothetical protein